MASRCSPVSTKQAEQIVLDFLAQHIPESQCPLAGNTVYVDRVFLMKHMPKLDRYLHYRIIDVSSIKELCRRWNKELFRTMPRKSFGHRAMNDIYESIEELRFYHDYFFRLM